MSQNVSLGGPLLLRQSSKSASPWRQGTSVSFNMCVCIYIYIYIHREREIHLLMCISIDVCIHSKLVMWGSGCARRAVYERVLLAVDDQHLDTQWSPGRRDHFGIPLGGTVKGRMKASVLTPSGSQ